MSKGRIKLLGFLFAVAVTVGCVSDVNQAAQQRKAAPADQTEQRLTLEVPDAAWEPAFFKQLEARTTAVNLPNDEQGRMAKDFVSDLHYFW